MSGDGNTMDVPLLESGGYAVGGNAGDMVSKKTATTSFVLPTLRVIAFIGLTAIYTLPAAYYTIVNARAYLARDGSEEVDEVIQRVMESMRGPAEAVPTLSYTLFTAFFSAFFQLRNSYEEVRTIAARYKATPRKKCRYLAWRLGLFGFLYAAAFPSGGFSALNNVRGIFLFGQIFKLPPSVTYNAIAVAAAWFITVAGNASWVDTNKTRLVGHVKSAIKVLAAPCAKKEGENTGKSVCVSLHDGYHEQVGRSCLKSQSGSRWLDVVRDQEGPAAGGCGRLLGFASFMVLVGAISVPSFWKAYGDIGWLKAGPRIIDFAQDGFVFPVENSTNGTGSFAANTSAFKNVYDHYFSDEQGGVAAGMYPIAVWNTFLHWGIFMAQFAQNIATPLFSANGSCDPSAVIPAALLAVVVFMALGLPSAGQVIGAREASGALFIYELVTWLFVSASNNYGKVEPSLGPPFSKLLGGCFEKCKGRSRADGVDERRLLDASTGHGVN